MRFFLLFILPAFLFFSCSIQKRHYRNGFYVSSFGQTKKHCVNPTIPGKDLSYKAARPVLNKEEAANEVTIRLIPGKETRIESVTRQARVSSVKTTRKIPLLKKVTKVFYGSVIPNAVAKAGFRMMLLSLGFAGCAWLLFLTFPELVYIIVTFLLVALVFAAVSLLASVNARADKINNSPAWLFMATLDAILDILLICVIVLFIISLF